MSYWLLGYPEKGLATGTESLALAEVIGDPLCPLPFRQLLPRQRFAGRREIGEGNESLDRLINAHYVNRLIVSFDANIASSTSGVFYDHLGPAR
jgi:hypothetical protein